MKTIITLFLLLFPCYAMAGEMQEPVQQTDAELVVEWYERHERFERVNPAPSDEVRIVKCTNGSYAVQERRSDWEETLRLGTEEPPQWWVLAYGCDMGLSLEQARWFKADVLRRRNPPPVPAVKVPFEVVE